MRLMFHAAPALSQHTVFHVPSGDVLDRGKVYFEFDATYMPRSAVRTFTPRIVVGLDRQIAIGLNMNGLSAPEKPQAPLTPTIQGILSRAITSRLISGAVSIVVDVLDDDRLGAQRKQ